MKQFETPDFEIVELLLTDVITTSGEGDWNGDEGDNGTNWH